MVARDDVRAVGRRGGDAGPRYSSRRERTWVRFGAVLMLIVGSFSVIEGLLALLAPTAYVSVHGTVLAVDFQIWGWTHILVGAAVLVLGLLLLRRGAPGWVRACAIAVIGLSMIAHLAWLPAQPFWSVIMVIIDVIVLRAIVLTWDDPAPPASVR